MNHKTLPEFWHHYRRVPKGIKELADKNFKLLKADSRHPSLHNLHKLCVASTVNARITSAL